MSEPRAPYRRPRVETDFTVKIRYCKGCHNELGAEQAACPVCGTAAPSPLAPGATPGEPDPEE